MLRWIRPIGFLLAIVMAHAAAAACAGVDMRAEMQRKDPGAYAEMQARAAATLNGEGIFWRVEAPGVPPSYLYGTMHVAPVEGVSDAAWRALDGSRVFLMEMTKAEKDSVMQRMATNPSLAFDLTGPTLRDRLNDADEAILEKALSDRGMTLNQVDRARPWLLTSIFVLPRCMQGVALLDDALADRAAGGGKPVLGLETFDDVRRAFDSLPPDLVLENLVAGLPHLDRQEDRFKTLSALYAEERIAEVFEFLHMVSDQIEGATEANRESGEAMLETLVDGRNRAWLPAIAAQVVEGGAFIAVGAGHLPGEAGLIELLRAEGFTVTRIRYPTTALAAATTRFRSGNTWSSRPGL